MSDLQSLRLACGRFAIVSTAAFVAIIIVLANVPSDMKPTAIRRASDPLTHSYFQQRWKLFAPNPLPGNDQLLLEAMVEDDHGGRRITRPYDLQESAVSLVRTQRLLPSKLVAYPLFHQYLLLRRDGYPAYSNSPSVRTVTKMTQRYLSAMAERVFPGERIVLVRATLVFVPAASRRRAGEPAQVLQGRTGWLSFVSGVGE